MNCKQCSAPLGEGAAFCDSCGAPVASNKAQDPLLGRTLINQYIIRKKLGFGGFGSVYEAEQPSMGRKVAVKTLHQHLVHNAQIVARFHREGMAASRLEHPASVKMFNSGETEDGILWIAMEFLEGETLDARVRKKGRLTTAELIEIFRPICEVLEEAHEKGIVHRDLKPDNIMLLPRRGKDQMKLLDFGIAGLLGDGKMTQTGIVSGTPMYMSPEQWKGLKHTDARSDIYAMGVIAYQCISGRLPFEADTAPGWMQKHCLEEPKELTTSDCPEAVRRVILKALSKDPDHRYQTVMELSQALEAALQSPEPKVNSQAETLASAIRESAPPPPTLPPAPQVISVETPKAKDEEHITAPIAVHPKSKAPFVVIGGIVAASVAAWLVLSPTKKKQDPEQAVVTPSSTQLSKQALTTVAAPDEKPKNRWIKIEPPTTPVTLGLSGKKLPVESIGFREERKIQAPQLPFLIQEHEVTWGEFDEWLFSSNQSKTLPAELKVRSKQAATAVPWAVAGDFCASIGGRLPTEEEWEYAARGQDRRPYPWGDEPLDLGRSFVYAGTKAVPGDVMTHSQDRTPNGVYDLLGNAQEWTTSLWREDVPGQDESWVQQGETSFRAVRGLPLNEAPPAKYPQEAAAYRGALCATGTCAPETADLLKYVGFRCVKEEQ